MGVGQIVDLYILLKEETDGCQRNRRFAELIREKKMGVHLIEDQTKRMQIKKNGCWMNSRFDIKKKKMGVRGIKDQQS